MARCTSSERFSSSKRTTIFSASMNVENGKGVRDSLRKQPYSATFPLLLPCHNQAGKTTKKLCGQCVLPLLGLRGLRAVLKCGCKGMIFIWQLLDNRQNEFHKS